jgi:hypothetical protein
MFPWDSPYSTLNCISVDKMIKSIFVAGRTNLSQLLSLEESKVPK